MATPRNRIVRGLGYSFYLFATVAIGLEVLVRVFTPQVLPVAAPEIFLPDDAMGWKHAANVRVMANTGERNVEICTDAQGDRISCLAPQPADCSRRILVVGDSMVEALAIPFEQTAWAALQRVTGACVDVAGVSGYGPSQ